MTNNQRFKALRGLPCCRCGKSPIQVAHSNFYEHGKSRGKKAYDKYTIPLCHSCHQWFDQYQQMSRADSKKWFDEKLNNTNRISNVEEKFEAF